MARGTYGPSLGPAHPSPDPGSGDSDSGSTAVTVLFTGTRAAPPWPRLALRHLTRLRRPPVPSPFYLATAAITVDLAAPSR